MMENLLMCFCVFFLALRWASLEEALLGNSGAPAEFDFFEVGARAATERQGKGGQTGPGGRFLDIV